jgi:hypothetical protein
VRRIPAVSSRVEKMACLTFSLFNLSLAIINSLEEAVKELKPGANFIKLF